MEFKKLNPTDDVELGVYEKALEFVFSDDDIQNIAISGVYGAGKSSMLESYKKKLEKQGSKKKFLHISLAHFEDTNNEDTGYAQLEGKILNQLLHQIEVEKIPLTNFKIKREADTSRRNKMTAGIIGLMAIILYYVFYKQWCILVGEFRNISLKFTLTPGFKVLLILIAFGIVSYFVNYTIKIQIEKNVFKKLSFQGTEIELFTEETASYFDKYLNEVIYLFDCSGADVIVFEDMDRFKDVRIFERLREINLLVNNSRKESEKEPLRFFYLLRDDIFTTKDRTKFFDYIIPVVPVVDGSNSYSELKKTLQEEINQGKIEMKFLQSISLFIDDMRVLKNICNEFFIYNMRINDTNLDRNKLLAMITYKNVFPRDFSDLQMGKGYIHTVLSGKEAIISSRIELIENKIDAINDDLQKMDREILNDRREVGAALAEKHYSGYSWSGSADIVQWIEKRNDQRIIEELHERLRIVELKQNDRKEELLKEKERLLEEKQRIYEEPLHQLITKENERKVFGITRVDFNGDKKSYEDVKGNDYFPLLKYLVWNGYIDEFYSDYMTYFYEGRMKKGDKVFLQAVAGHERKKHDYSIQNPEVVISSLRNCDFEQEETLNYDLFAFLLSDKKQNWESQRTKLIMQIKERRDFDFLAGFLERKNMDALVVNNLCPIWPENFKELLLAGDVSAEFIWRWATDLVCYASEDLLELVNEQDVLSAYLSNERKILYIEGNSEESFVKNAVSIGLEVADLQVYAKDNPVYHLLVNNCLFEISMPNINYILKTLYGEDNDKELATKNYSLLRKYEEGVVCKYLTNRMEDYAACFIEAAEEIHDDYETVLLILNHETLSDNTKQLYITKLTTTIERLDDIEYEPVWDDIVSGGVLDQNEENLFCYYEKKGLTEKLVSFINQFQKPMDFSSKFEDKDDVKEKLFSTVVTNNTLRQDKYEQLVDTLGYQYTEFSIRGIGQEQMNILIKCGVVLMNENTLSFMREYYEQNMIEYLLKYFNQYLSVIEENKVPDEEVKMVLNELLLKKKISEKQALSFLKKVNGEISLDGKTYPDGVMMEILQKHLSEEDFKFLFERYDMFSKTVQTEVVKIGLDQIKIIVQGRRMVSKQLVMDLLDQTSLSKSEKVNLLVAAIAACKREEIEQCLEKCGKNEFCKIFDFQLRPRYEITEENEKLLQAFKEQGYISEYLEDKEQKYYRVRRAH